MYNEFSRTIGKKYDYLQLRSETPQETNGNQN